jgi:fumarate reductase flavoprotein subunit
MTQLKTDVVVIAAGAAGLPASLAAAQSGAKVIVFEKGATTGGTGSMGMGPFGVESRLQKLKQMGPDRDQAFKMFMDYTHWRVDARLVRAYIDKAATSIDWLESLGVEFVEPAAYFPGGQFTWHLVKPEQGEPGPMAAGTMMKRLTDRAKELGVDLRLQTPVTKILRTGDHVTGVVAETASGDVLEVDSPTVIVATGGFGDNPEMIKKYLGYEWGKDLFSFRVPGIAGDGIRMAWEVGAAPSDMNIEMIYGMPAEPNFPMMALFGQPHLMVNLLGQRFVDESIMGNTTFTGNAIAAQKNKTGFVLFDSEIKQVMEAQGFDHVHAVFRIPGLRDIDGLVAEAQAGGNHAVITADSLDELAAKTGIDAAGLKATVEEYNGFCESGFDPRFNKSHHLLRPLRGPRYYAGVQMPSAYGTLGGIKINEHTEVLDKQWRPIGGLYAAGTDACSIYGDSYVFILPGNTMGFAINSGRIAGENAAAYAAAQG